MGRLALKIAIRLLTSLNLLIVVQVAQIVCGSDLAISEAEFELLAFLSLRII
jgi:hypothetical protein